MSTDKYGPVSVTGRPAKSRLASQDIVYLLVFGGAVFYAFAWKFSENTSMWVQILFSLPVFAQLIGGAFHIRRARAHGEEHRSFYSFSMWSSTIFIAAYCLLWIAYSNGFKSYRVFSWLALLVITGLICMVGYLMCAFLHVPDGDKWPTFSMLRNGAAAEPLWALSFLFFVIFLDVTYLFGFAFAFHDQHCLSVKPDTPALRMVNLDSPDDVKSPPKSDAVLASGKEAGQGESESNGNGASRAAAVLSNANGKNPGYYFYFDSSQAHLDRGTYEDDIKKQVEEEDKKRTNDNNVSRSATDRHQELETNFINARCEIQDGDVSPLKRSIWVARDFRLNNFCSLEQVSRRIEQETNKGRRTRIVLVGRADDQPIIEGKRLYVNDNFQRYKSNYELSEARVQNVRYEIAEALKKQDDTEGWHNLEWLTLPSSNENPERDDDLKKILDSQPGLPLSMKQDVIERNKRVVVASIVSIPDDITSLQMKQLNRSQFKELNLMDYMYFSIYTITTTGYGDIIPTTAYSKFVISVANICEVLFLVVFFNALVSIRGEKKREPEVDKKSSDNPLDI
jgi:hypothetical protein